jgi:hypothetical protein
MVALHLLKHYSKSVIRNASWRRNIIGKIVFGILIVYLLMLFIFIGYKIDDILTKAGGNPVSLFNSFLIWYLISDLIMRTIFLSMPTIQVIPYLHLPIPRYKIINYLIGRNLWNIFNILPWFIIIPFSVKILSNYYNGLSVFSYFSCFTLILLFNNLLSSLIKYLSQKNIFLIFIPFLLLGILYSINHWITPVNEISSYLGFLMLKGDLATVITLLLFLLTSFWLHHRLLLRGFYMDDIKTKKNGLLHSGFLNMNLFNRFGLIGKYMDFELNLTFRNKRPRQGLIMAPVILIYFIFISSHDKHMMESGGFFIYLISIYVGIAAMVYGQYLFSWESCCMDGIMARNLNLTKYLQAKYYYLVLLVLIMFIPTFTASFFIPGFKPLMMLSSALFVIGVMLYAILLMSSNNDGRIDLSKSQFFNYQGVKGHHFLTSFAVFLIPFFIYLGIKALFNENIALIIQGVIGIIGIGMHKIMLSKLIAPRLIKRKYKNLEGFRKLTA